MAIKSVSAGDNKKSFERRDFCLFLVFVFVFATTLIYGHDYICMAIVSRFFLDRGNIRKCVYVRAVSAKVWLDVCIYCTYVRLVLRFVWWSSFASMQRKLTLEEERVHALRMVCYMHNTVRSACHAVRYPCVFVQTTPAFVCLSFG